MVSFFGLKLGGDKKKKASATEQAVKQQEWKKVDQNLLGEGQFFGLEPRGVPNGSIRSGAGVTRPGTSHSTRVGGGPYSHETHNLAAASMFDLSQQGRRVPNLKQTQSDANLRLNLGNESSTSLQLPRPIGGSRPGTPNRPGTSDGTARNKTWVNPLDIHFSRPIPSGPRSPLGQSDAQTEDGGDNDSLFGDKPENVAQEIINRVNTAEELKSLPSPTGSLFYRPVIPSPLASPVLPSPSAMLPSPPQSIVGTDKGIKRDARTHVLAGSPSPPLSSPRESANGEVDQAESGEGRPVVQNVRAKRDTLTVNPNRRQSLSMRIEEFEKSLVKEQREAQQAFDFGLNNEEPEQVAPPKSQQRQQQEERRSPPLALGNNGSRPESPAGYGQDPSSYMIAPRPSSPGPRRGGPAGGPMRGPMGPSMGGQPRGPLNAQRGQPPMRSPVERSMGGDPMGPSAGGQMRGLRGDPSGPRPGQPRGVPMHAGRPHSPSGIRGPRSDSPMGRVPRPHSPAGMRGPRPDSQMGRVPRQQSPAGMRGHRPESPMGRVPRPHSPAGMRGPRPESPMGRVPRPHSPAGVRGPPGQSPMGRVPRSESPMGRPPRRAPSPGRLRLTVSAVGRQPADPASIPRSPMGPPPPRAQTPVIDSTRGRGPTSPNKRAPRDESPIDPWPMSDKTPGHPQSKPQPQESKGFAVQDPLAARPQAPPPPPSHMPLESPTFGAFDTQKTMMLPLRQPSPKRSDSLERPSTTRSVKPRGLPTNRPPRPSLDEYGVPVARRVGPPVASFGARHGEAAVSSPVQAAFPSNVRAARPEAEKPMNSAPFKPAAQATGLADNNPFRFSSDDEDDESFFPIQRPSLPTNTAPARVPASVPVLRNFPPAEAKIRPKAASRPRPPPLFDLGLNAPAGLLTPNSTGASDAQDSWPLPSPSALSTPRSARAPPPAPLNLAVTADEYMNEIGGGPWTPPPGQKMDHGSDVVSPVEGPWEDKDLGKPSGDIGLARGMSVKMGAGADATSRRPDYGLKSPTGIADRFGTGFI